MSGSETRHSRRDVLKAAGSGVVATVAVSGTTSASDEETIAFTDLSAAAKSAFRTALNQGTFVADEALPSEFSEYLFVSYRGTTYEVNYLHVRDEIPDELSVTRVAASAVPEEATVLQASDLSERAVATLKQAQNAPVEAPARSAYEANDRYVELGGRTYHVGVLKRDAPMKPAIAPAEVGGEN